ncbi:MAG: beta-galactosidase, partial [Kiritimatiellia bacterium]
MTLKRLTMLCLPFAALLIATRPATAYETSHAEVEEYHQLSLRVETPHTKWAKPYAGGTTRVLYFVASNNEGMETYARHVVELMQRFDVEVTPVYWYRYFNYHWLGGMAANRRLHALMTRKPYDVYVFQGVSPTNLPSWPQDGAKEALAQAVAAGAGVVFIGAGDGGTITNRQDCPEVPAFLAGSGVSRVFTADKGRGVILPGLPDIPYQVGWETTYDYWQEGFGRAVLWAAGRAPKARIELTVPATVRRDDLPVKAVTVAAKNLPKGNVRWQASLRRWDGQQTPLGEGSGGAAARLKLPVLRAGAYHVDLIARSERGVEAWTTSPFEVTASTKVQSIDLKTAWAEIGEVLAGTVSVTNLSRRQTVRVQLKDRRGRVLAQQDVKPVGDDGQDVRTAPFEFPVRDWMPMLVTVAAVVLDADREVASDYRFFNVTKRHRGKFNFVLWDISDKQALAPYMAESMQRYGVNAIVTTKSPMPAAAASELAWVPMTGGNVNAGRHLTVSPPTEELCWSTRHFSGARGHGVFQYSLGDEGAVFGAAPGPKTLPGYRLFLKEMYGDIAALNASWGAAFASFDEVDLSEKGDGDEKAALKAGNYPRWYDRQAFLRWNFVEYAKVQRDVMRKIDPEAAIGFEGSGGFARSGDIDAFCREMNFWVPYASSADEMIRSLAPTGMVYGNWIGYDHTADGLLSKYWRMVVNGANSVWWWMWSTMGGYEGFIHPDLGILPIAETMLKDTQVVRDGLGDLLMQCEMLDDGIAMLYSMPSGFAATLQECPSYNDYEPNHRAWFTIIHDQHMQFRYVSDRMLTRGEFVPDKYKVLVLAQALALGDKEAEIVRDFVRRGGTVIADLRPGVFDGHCKPRERGALDDLFGVTGPVRQKAVQTAMTVDLPKDKASLKLAWPNAIVDPGTRLDGGKAFGAAGETPVWIVREHDKGRAVLLNFSLFHFSTRKVADGLTEQGSTEQTPPAVWNAFRQLFSEAGVRPVIDLCQYKGARELGNVKIQRWRNGDMQLV